MPATPTRRGVPPQLVALIRAAVMAVAVAAIAAVAHVLAGADLSDVPAEWRPLVLAAVGITVRTLEGIVDRLRGQANQAGPLGGAPANPLDYAIHADDVRAASPVARSHTGAALLTVDPAAAVDWLDNHELGHLRAAVDDKASTPGGAAATPGPRGPRTHPRR